MAAADSTLSARNKFYEGILSFTPYQTVQYVFLYEFCIHLIYSFI